eukprot:11372104-Heterocapsa_arctica.AAC.1
MQQPPKTFKAIYTCMCTPVGPTEICEHKLQHVSKRPKGVAVAGRQFGDPSAPFNDPLTPFSQLASFCKEMYRNV